MEATDNDEIRCPAGARWPGDLPGCGSPNVIRDPTDGMWDCLTCGLYFSPGNKGLRFRSPGIPEIKHDCGG
jgi:ribosomal protein L37AE/L43A